MTLACQEVGSWSYSLKQYKTHYIIQHSQNTWFCLFKEVKVTPNISLLLQYLARKCSTLQNLSLDACTCLKSSDVSRIVETVPNLKFFSLSQRFPLLNQQSLLSLGNLTHLQELNLKYNECVNDQIVAAIVAGCKELTVVNISGKYLLLCVFFYICL